MYDCQKADFDQLATDASYMKAAFDTQKVHLDAVQVGVRLVTEPSCPCLPSITSLPSPQGDAVDLKQGYDGLATANRQLVGDAVESKAAVDMLQVGPFETYDKGMHDGMVQIACACVASAMQATEAAGPRWWHMLQCGMCSCPGSDKSRACAASVNGRDAACATTTCHDVWHRDD
jgi:hypothetical protein